MNRIFGAALVAAALLITAAPASASFWRGAASRAAVPGSRLDTQRSAKRGLANRAGLVRRRIAKALGALTVVTALGSTHVARADEARLTKVEAGIGAEIGLSGGSIAATPTLGVTQFLPPGVFASLRLNPILGPDAMGAGGDISISLPVAPVSIGTRFGPFMGGGVDLFPGADHPWVPKAMLGLDVVSALDYKSDTLLRFNVAGTLSSPTGENLFIHGDPGLRLNVDFLF